VLCAASIAVNWALAVRADVVARNPALRKWRRSLEYSLEQMGGEMLADGDVDATIDEYCAGLEIATRLLALEPTNHDWQLDPPEFHAGCWPRGMPPRPTTSIRYSRS
jgi:hypothetical protein